MATPTKIHLSPETTGVVNIKPQTVETAAKTSALLQENHDNHHIFFNADGFHNHIAHHLLTLYGLGASKSQIEKAYRENVTYQRPSGTIEERVVKDMSDPVQFKKYLGKEKYYPDFLAFFKTEMEKYGWQKVLQQYMFAGDERADDILGRMHGGFLHPIIHLGFGVEFQQPAIIAEALAQACVHENWTSKYLFSVQSHLKSHPLKASKAITSLLTEIRSDKDLFTAVHWEDSNKIRDGILARAPDSMIHYASQFSSSPSTLKSQLVEMINSSIYFTAAAQHPPKQVKFDFYYMHCVNASIFYPSFLSLPFLSEENKVRLLNFKVWLDLTMYSSRRSPTLLLDEISNYVPTKLPDGAKESGWEDIFERLMELSDDGHASKLGRAVKYGQIMSEGYEKQEWCMIKGDLWEKVGNMVVDSVEDTGEKWARSVGFDDAWEKYEDRSTRAQL